MHVFVFALLAAAPSLPAVSTRLQSPQTGQTTFVTGTLSAPLTGELSQAALAWALAHRAEFGLPADSTLKVGPSFGTRFGASFHLQQYVGELQVDGAQLVVTIDSRARVVQVSSSVADYRQALTALVLSPQQALRAAAAEVPLPMLGADSAPQGGVRQVALQAGDEVHAGYVVHVATVAGLSNWFVGVDGVTGAVLWKQNRVHFGALDAGAYNSSPGGLNAGVGVTPTISVSLTHPDGGSMVVPNDGGLLVGTQIDAYNCCINENCNATYETYPDGGTDGGPYRARGMTRYTLPVLGPTNITYDVAACQKLPRATNEAARHASGDYVYPPFDPPDAGPIVQGDPANSDEFAEVHAFYQVNRVYDWVRGLSAAAAPLFPGNQPAIVPFQMRDERLGKKPAVWANIVFPDFNELVAGGIASLACIQNPPCRINGLLRIDNAAFMPTEESTQIPLPQYQNSVDTLMIFQGAKADFAYDAPVLWHEFGHGAVYATAGLGFSRLSIDQLSANNEQGALHEGFADYIAGAYGNNPLIGEYVGPRIGGGGNAMGVRQDTYLRTLDNTFTCPDVLWGEVHQDSQHVSGALWRVRQDFLTTAADRAKYDATFYAMLVSLSPAADFAEVAAAMTSHVQTAFGAAAATAMQNLFTSRGVVNCSKVVDITADPKRPYYGLGGTSQSALSASSLIPGPHQMMIRAPVGATSVTLTAAVGGGLQSIGGSTPTLKLLAKVGQPIKFTKVGNQLQANAESQVDVTVSGSSATATAKVTSPCNVASDVYLTLANTGKDGTVLQNLQVSFERGCATPDAGPADAGGSEVTTVPVAGGNLGAPYKACGCTASGAVSGLLAVLLLGALRRRR